MKNDLSRLMKQAQKMQEDMQKAQQELGKTEVSGQAGGGMVSVVMNCRHEVRKVTIDSAVPADDREMMEDLVAAAFNDAVRKVESTIKEKFSGMTAGLGLPAGMGLPF